METLKVSDANVEECVARAAAALQEGGVVLYPTDTLYGLGADALSDEAVAKMYALKGREEKKPIHCIVASIEEAERYGEFNESARALAQEFWPGALTLVLRKRHEFNTGIFRGRETIGIRIPDHEFCLALAHEFAGPFTTTSANVSGAESPRTISGILGQLGSDAGIDLVVDAGELPARQPSTVVDVTGSEPEILREGAISASKILNVLGR